MLMKSTLLVAAAVVLPAAAVVAHLVLRFMQACTMISQQRLCTYVVSIVCSTDCTTVKPN
jgi:flagellar biosynthesis protein FliQ